MREIKFRAWWHDEKRMVYICDDSNDTSIIFHEEIWQVFDHFTGSMNELFDSSDGELMQYTGLKDKNGKEI